MEIEDPVALKPPCELSNDRRSVPPLAPPMPVMPSDCPVAASGAGALLTHATEPLDPTYRLPYACTDIECRIPDQGGTPTGRRRRVEGGHPNPA